MERFDGCEGEEGAFDEAAESNGQEVEVDVRGGGGSGEGKGCSFRPSEGIAGADCVGPEILPSGEVSMIQKCKTDGLLFQ